MSKDLVIQVACQRFQNDPSLAERTSLTKNDISNSLEFCPNTTYSLYQKVHRTAVGSPIFVVVANLVMEDVESQAIASLSSSPHFWKRYIDNTCCALQKDLLQNFHYHLHSIEPSNQITLKTESEGQLNMEP